jgi:F0F1-type ATP synthase membrane subunit c/vacuolar-type H+-ATPase subunit K
MKNFIRQTHKNIGLLVAGLFIVAGVVAAIPTGTVQARVDCGVDSTYSVDANGNCVQNAGSSSSATPAPTSAPATSSTPKVTQFAPSDAEKDPALSGGNCANLGQCDLMSKYVNPAIRLFTAFIGVGVAIAIVYGGVEYGSSGGDPAKAAAGKNRIRNAIFTLVAYFFLYALLNFLIPGGVNS